MPLVCSDFRRSRCLERYILQGDRLRLGCILCVRRLAQSNRQCEKPNFFHAGGLFSGLPGIERANVIGVVPHFTNMVNT
jgi:hypothetical protein